MATTLSLRGAFTFLLTALIFSAAHGQDKPASSPVTVLLDATQALGTSLRYTSAAGWLLFGLDEGQRIQAGAGLRASYYRAGSTNYEGQNTPAGELLRVPNPRLLALNAAFHFRVRIAGPLRIGGNFDFVGLSVGPAREAQASATPGQKVSSHPALLNLIRDEQDSRGSLNSELYAAADLPHRFVARLGVSRASTAYSTDQLTSSLARYRLRDTLLALGLSYSLR